MHTYTHIHSLACPGNTSQYTFKNTQMQVLVCISCTNTWETTLYRPCLCPLSFLYVCGAPLPPPTLIHLLSLGRILRLLTASATLFLCEFIHIFTQQALSTHYTSGTVLGSGDPALLLASCWGGSQSGRDGERLWKMGRSVSMALFLWEAYPVPIITICLSLRR